MSSVTLMDAGRMARTISRIAHEILERHPDVKKLALVGIRSRGVPIARRLARAIAETTGAEPAVGALDIALYRDDFTSLAAQPITKGTDILFSIDGRTVVLVDDVLFTGRMVRAALDQLIDFGRPSRIELAVLVDLGHRELPIRADYAGRVLTTSRDEAVQVLVREEDGKDEVVLVPRPASPLAGKPAAKPAAGAPGGGPRRGPGGRALSPGRARVRSKKAGKPAGAGKNGAGKKKTRRAHR